MVRTMIAMKRMLRSMIVGRRYIECETFLEREKRKYQGLLHILILFLN